jgi:hypothetical protein
MLSASAAAGKVSMTLSGVSDFNRVTIRQAALSSFVHQPKS